MSESTSSGGKYLLDTNTVIHVLAEKIDLRARSKAGAEAFLSIVVLGELYFGAEKSTNVGGNLERLESFAASLRVLPCDSETARHYGKIRNQLRARGRPIPENDIWIAATAQQHGLTLVSRDGHFGEVEGLSREAW